MAAANGSRPPPSRAEKVARIFRHFDRNADGRLARVRPLPGPPPLPSPWDATTSSASSASPSPLLAQAAGRARGGGTRGSAAAAGPAAPRPAVRRGGTRVGAQGVTSSSPQRRRLEQLCGEGGASRWTWR